MAKKKQKKALEKPNNEDKTLTILTHVLALFFSFVAPLIILLSSNKEIVKKHSKNALNWQISFILYSAISLILAFVIIGIFILIAVSIMNLIFCIVAAVKASNNEMWDYPLTIKFVGD
jgi:uncharacterized protein